MKCISKRKKQLHCLEYLSSDLPAAPSKEVVLENAYDVCDTSAKYGITENGASQSAEFFARDLVVTEDENLGLEKDNRTCGRGGRRIFDFQKRSRI